MSTRKGSLVAAVLCTAALMTVLPATPASAGWTKSVSVVPGRYADAEVFRLPDGRYRMLYGTESEVAPAQSGIYSSTSRDGRTWRSDGRVLAGSFSGPDVVRLPTGGYRMYLNGSATTAGTTVWGVVSYTSHDGATWQPESGLRLLTSWLRAGERFGFTSTTHLPGGTWLMAYEVDRDGRYLPNVPTGRAEIRWATSSDGLTFTRRGIAVDPRNTLLLGSARSPEFFGGQLYFHSHKGIFKVTLKYPHFTSPAQLVLPACRARTVFPWTPPPADPTLARIGTTTMLFHGDHTRGIFRAVMSSTSQACFQGVFVR